MSAISPITAFFLFFPFFLPAQYSVKPFFSANKLPVESVGDTLIVSYAYKAAGVYVLTDQDVLQKPYNEDRNYTMGILIGAYGPWANNKKLVLPWLRGKMDKLFGLDSVHAQSTLAQRSALYMAGSGFTPLAIDSTLPIRNDRPYGSLLILGSSHTSVREIVVPWNRPWALTTSFSFGFLGLNVAKTIQSHIHEKHWLGSTRPIPLGWHNQVSNGGEPTFLYQGLLRSLIFQKDRFSVRRNGPMNRFQLAGTLEGMVGYYDNVAIGIDTRFGYFSNPFWDMNSNMSNGMNENPETNLLRDGIDLYLFASLRSRFVGYNALLQGQFRKSAHTLNAAQIERIVGEYEMGIGLKIYNLNVLWTITAGRTPEYRTALARPHIWGGVQLRYDFRYKVKTVTEI